MEASEISQICKALGDENRLKIITLLTNGEKCACELLEEFNITQPTLSHHMKILSECMLVKSRKDGKNIYYEINCCKFKAFKKYFEEIQCWKDKIPLKENESECCCNKGD